ncbi:hypothetical protein ABI59_22800 [Acidobacteria bacterium Mor1]|nr:hypothetical protein ABI59_22800 [Acidobacteria bacterium Mor1]
MTAATTSAFADDGQRLKFRAPLTGDEEVPNPVITDTRGLAEFTVSEDGTRIRYNLAIDRAERIFAGPGAHLHCAPFGSNGPVVAFLAGGLPIGLNGKVRVRGTIDSGMILPTECGETVEEVVESILDGRVYVNVHSAGNPAGEVRGQVEEAN